MSSCEIKSLPSQKDAAKRSEVTPRLISSNVVPPALKAFAQGKTYSIRTYGCQANIRDEEILAGFLTRAGFTRTLDPRKASLAIINTCAVTAEAARDAALSARDETLGVADEISDEIADVIALLTDLCSDLNIDIDEAVLRKIAKNQEKYPVSQFRGSARKYNQR